MKLHPNARITPFQRELLVERVERLGWHMGNAAQAAGVSERTGWKWHDPAANPTIGDTICNRLVHNAHCIVLKGLARRKRALKGN